MDASNVLGLPRDGKNGGQTVEAVDGIRSAVQAWEQWVVANPCPDPQLGDQFEVFVARCRFLALVSIDPRIPDAASPLVGDDRFNRLNADFGEFLSDLRKSLAR